MVIGHALTVDERRAGFKDSSFHRCFNDGRLSLPAGSIRAYTVGLHRPNPAAREMPGFIGFFARRKCLAEREGLAPQLKVLIIIGPLCLFFRNCGPSQVDGLSTGQKTRVIRC